MQAQERLLVLDWPQSLLRHELCRPVALGDLLKDSNSSECDVAGKGGPVISGLRVRMGINTGEGGGGNEGKGPFRD